MHFHLSGQPLVVAITISSGSCYLLFGYDQGVLGGLVTQPSFLNAIGNPNEGYLGAIVALYNIGCLVGCVLSAMYGSRFGRKRSIIGGSLIMVVGAILQASTYGAVQLIVGRIISGVGNGTVRILLRAVVGTFLISFRDQHLYHPNLCFRDGKEQPTRKNDSNTALSSHCR